MITNLINLAALSVSKTEVNIPKAELNDTQMQGIIAAIFAVAGAVAVVFIVLGGIRYTISQGNAADLQKGKDMIVYALVGLVFVIMAFAIVQLVTQKLF